ncbi:hypothetical protein NPX13_g7118 [Xylaria arbuscula]|uniref:Uncharacterized protein n=1 Tax=Xylaria arbuscula TaxID=114810 RepID=A0A9W8NB60_9PEZI|nr:hypothetical protein NPX13_g7118 [Xylaria arbuscula]
MPTEAPPPRLLVAREGGLPLDGLKAGQAFTIQVESNPKGNNEADHCLVRVVNWETRELVMDLFIEFTFINQTVIYNETCYLVDPGAYFIDAIYYDKRTHLAYDKHFYMFRVLAN